MTTPAPRSPGGERGDVGAVERTFRMAAELVVQDVRAQRGDHIASLVEDSFEAHFDRAAALAADREPGLREAENDAWLRRTLAGLIEGKDDGALIRVGVLRRALELTQDGPR